MSAQIIDGKAIAATIREEIKTEVHRRRSLNQPIPGLAVVMVGEDPASAVYVRNKRKACEEIGMESVAYDLPASTSQQELVSLIDKLNSDPKIHGILGSEFNLSISETNSCCRHIWTPSPLLNGSNPKKT